MPHARAVAMRPSRRMFHSISALCQHQVRQRARMPAALLCSTPSWTTHRPGRGGPWCCAGQARSPRGTQGRPLRAVLHSKGSRPGRGGPLRCVDRARSPRGTQGRPLRAGSCSRGVGQAEARPCAWASASAPLRDAEAAIPMHKNWWRPCGDAAMAALAACFPAPSRGKVRTARAALQRLRIHGAALMLFPAPDVPPRRAHPIARLPHAFMPPPSLGACDAAAAPLGIRRKAARRTRPCTRHPARGRGLQAGRAPSC